MATLEENIKQSIADFDSIKAAIERKGVAVPYGTDTKEYGSLIETIGADEYDRGFEDGKNSVVDYLRYAKTVQFNSLNDFGKAEVELNLNKCTTLLNLCAVLSAENRNNTVEHLIINCDNPTNIGSMLNCGYQFRDEKLKRVTLNMDTSNVTNFSNTFNCLIALEVIDGEPLNLSSATTTTNMNNYNTALKEIRFVEKSIFINISFACSPSISADTIQSIIDGLADLTGGTAQTITWHSEITKLLIAEQYAQIWAKNWKSN